MRISLHPIRSLERDFKISLIHSILKFLFILGIALLVFILTSRTYVPAAGMNNTFERVPQEITAPPAPSASSDIR